MPVEILTGQIASGKSAYATERARQGALVVNPAAIVDALHGGLHELRDNDALKKTYGDIVESVLVSAIRTKRDVVVDSTNHTEDLRRAILRVAQAEEANVVCTVFERNTPVYHAEAAGHIMYVKGSEYLDIAAKIESEWQEPNGLEGFKHITLMKERTMDDVVANTTVADPTL